MNAVADELRDRVLPGHQGDFLPGTRILAGTLGVSVPTVCKALHQLGAEGALVGGGKRRRWRVADMQAPSSPTRRSGNAALGGKKPRSRRLLFLSAKPLRGERFSGVEIYAALLDKLATSDWEVIYRVMDFWNTERPRRVWNEMLEFTMPDAIVAISGTETLGKWLVDKKIRTLFIGGTRGTSGVPAVFVSVSSMLGDAAGRLFAQGHRRLLFPLFGRAPALVKGAADTAKQVTEAMGIPQKCLVVTESKYSGPEVVINLLRAQWKKEPPDAVIFLDWREFVAAESFFNEAGVSIPRDLSVIVLSQNGTMEWRQPAISHYEHPVNPMARAIAKWVLHGKAGLADKNDHEFPARWVSRESVRPRAGAADPPQTGAG